MSFLWGVAATAYQMEGAIAEDGKSLSVWDTFAHEPGRIIDGTTGDVAVDHYHRYREDVALMAELGVDVYSLSVAWTRVQPDGTGPVNAAGIGFYDRLVDALLEQGISPWLTLYHWDLPQTLEDQGGWLNRDTAFRYAEYVALVADALGDRAGAWVTLNEPFVHTVFGYGLGMHAPGKMLLFEALPAAHHQLLGHGLAVAALRPRSRAPITIANHYTPVRAVGDRDEDQIAAAFYDALHNRVCTEPLFGRGYPEMFDMPVRDGDLETIAAPIDAIGVDYYMPTGVSAATGDDGLLPFDIVELPGFEQTEFGWPVDPDGLTEVLMRLHSEYQMPMYVTESGCAYPDHPDDQRRIDYHESHIGAVRAAQAQGADVRGYFVWTLIDNFEWAEGFTKRFGLVHLDPDTLARTPKRSFRWYREQISKNR
jgi:beta-glucosidase